FVPVYSSVKVKGQKLRVLARTHEKFTINKDHVVTFKKQNSEVHINLPSKIVKISKFDIVDFYKISTNELIKRLETYGDYLSAEIIQYLGSKDRELSIANVKINCSKGTYIRQLANDLGEAVNTSTMLVGLKRTQIGPWSISDAVTVEDLEANQ
ncbi:hypothetical protein KC669_04710, partial [Candidatus Dojkabacteria bacterium]|nr:hypothetical protein [Candidatus Dojkabacteria bacterium]